MQHRETLIGSSPRAARRRHGIRLRGRTVDASGSRGDVQRRRAGSQPSAVIWATGFGLDHSWIHAPVFDDSGRLVHERGVTASPGLYFLGLPWQHTRGSALLGWVKDDAAYIAEQIAAFASTSATPQAKSLASAMRLPPAA